MLSGFIAVCPMYSPPDQLAPLQTKCPLERTPSPLKMLPKIRATVVLPEPGLP